MYRRIRTLVRGLSVGQADINLGPLLRCVELFRGLG